MNITVNKSILERWENVSDDLAKYFVEKYFGKDAEQWWVADMIGSVLYVNDHFFDMEDICEFIRHKYSAKDMFKYYDYSQALSEKGEFPVNIKHWKKLCKNKSNKSQK